MLIFSLAPVVIEYLALLQFFTTQTLQNICGTQCCHLAAETGSWFILIDTAVLESIRIVTASYFHPCLIFVNKARSLAFWCRGLHSCRLQPCMQIFNLGGSDTHSTLLRCSIFAVKNHAMTRRCFNDWATAAQQIFKELFFVDKF